jgi:hypothetical protein
MSEMAVLCREGDTKILWDPEVQVEVDYARTSFEHFVSIGYAPFRMNGDGSTGERMREFDPSAVQIVFVPPLQGG